jgi:hypothetical protein
LNIFSDSDHGADRDDRRSQEGHCAFLRGNLLSWHSKKGSKVALSTATAELYALLSASKEGIYLKGLLNDLNIKDLTETTPTLLGDNQTANRLAERPKYTNQTKSEHIGQSYLHEKIKNGELNITYVRTQFNIADIFTKPLSPRVFKRLRDVLMGQISYAQAEEDHVNDILETDTDQEA